MPLGRKHTGWPSIFVLASFVAGIFFGWCLMSGDSPSQFYQSRKLYFWCSEAIIASCVLFELVRLKCPRCRSRALICFASSEVDRWLGQKTVTEDSFTLGAFQAHGGVKTRGMQESITVQRRTIPVTKRRILRTYRCSDCLHEFGRESVEEMV